MPPHGHLADVSQAIAPRYRRRTPGIPRGDDRHHEPSAATFQGGLDEMVLHG